MRTFTSPFHQNSRNSNRKVGSPRQNYVQPMLRFGKASGASFFRKILYSPSTRSPVDKHASLLLLQGLATTPSPRRRSSSLRPALSQRMNSGRWSHGRLSVILNMFALPICGKILEIRGLILANHCWIFLYLSCFQHDFG